MGAEDRGGQGARAASAVGFLLLACLCALVVAPARALASTAPEHVLTYVTGSLTWDNATGIETDGTARLSLFDAVYPNVESQDGDRVLAPGTEGEGTVRLKNDSGEAIRFVAVAYRLKDEATLPVEPSLEGEGLSDAQSYPLPDGISESQVIRAVTGTVAAGGEQDLVLAWSWGYYESDERDVLDTALGDRAAYLEADDVTAGILIVVEGDYDPSDPTDPDDPADPDDPTDPTDPEDPADPDDPSDPTDPDDPANPDGSEDTSDVTDPDDTYIYPQLPHTGDEGAWTAVAPLVAGSAALLVAFLTRRRGARTCERS